MCLPWPFLTSTMITACNAIIKAVLTTMITSSAPKLLITLNRTQSRNPTVTTARAVNAAVTPKAVSVRMSRTHQIDAEAW